MVLMPLSRLTLCREIIAKHKHPKPDMFRKFYMSVYCFPNPSSDREVNLLILIISLECSHQLVGLYRKRAK